MGERRATNGERRTANLDGRTWNGDGRVALARSALAFAKCVFLNVAEGLPDHRLGMRRRHFTLARNSLGEAVAGIDLANVVSGIQPARASELLEVAGRLASLIGGLLKRL